MKHPTLYVLLLFTALADVAWAQNRTFSAQHIEGEPRLEMIRSHRKQPSGEPPLLFVHGYQMGAWIFEDHYLPFFYEKGYDVCAVNLRGHGWSEGAEEIERATLEEYYTDLERAVNYVQAETGETPILIGFSMGAVLTQEYIHRHQPQAAVLLGMGNPRFGIPSFRNWIQRHTGEYDSANLPTLHHDPAFLRALFFGDDEQPKGHKKYITKLVAQAGSQVVWTDLENYTPQPAKSAKVLIVAGEQDPFTPSAALKYVRNLYDAEILILENTRHGVPVAESWKKGAKGILQFLRQLPVEEKVSLMGVEAEH